MERTYKVLLGLFAVTKETDGGHFSKCPDEYEHYCIHGLCRFVTEQNAPACRCESGFTGSRCEYLHLDWLIGDKKQIIIACVVAGLLILIVLIVFIFIGAQRNKLCRKKKRRKEGKPSETEKLNTIATSGPSPVPAETMATNAV
ncbi:probetacellulin isoform X2 [Denticeps clupeoides]|uniref:probetacellulin isoform X2 n=1 Tax=Denticeps clupeoides TaxID=299321 RepID=UPI0010A4C4E8|nr:probetacellulin-like isoform X2 [Denticeps clupeoides]